MSNVGLLSPEHNIDISAGDNPDRLANSACDIPPLVENLMSFNRAMFKISQNGKDGNLSNLSPIPIKFVRRVGRASFRRGQAWLQALDRSINIKVLGTALRANCGVFIFFPLLVAGYSNFLGNQPGYILLGYKNRLGSNRMNGNVST